MQSNLGETKAQAHNVTAPGCTKVRSNVLRVQHTQFRQALLPGARNDLHLTKSNSWSIGRKLLTIISLKN